MGTSALAGSCVVVLLLVGACGSDHDKATDVMGVACPVEECGFTPLAPAAYFIDPDLDPTTPLRVFYDVPAAGWESWTGAAKFSEVGHVAVTITTVSNVVSDGCTDHSGADPAIGPTVADLVAALTSLAPFRVTSPPTDVSAFGHPGVHFEWTVPDLPFEADGAGGAFTQCVGGSLMSWVGAADTEPGDGFYGYTGPGYAEEFWILDVEGTRLMIAAERSLDSSAADLAELQTILDSIRIEP